MSLFLQETHQTPPKMKSNELFPVANLLRHDVLSPSLSLRDVSAMKHATLVYASILVP